MALVATGWSANAGDESVSTVSTGAPVPQDIEQAKAGPILRGVDGHMMRYYISLPADWEAGRRFPVIVAVTGSNGNFPVLARGYAKARGPLPFITVTPTSLSSTNPDFMDEKRFPQLDAEALAGWKKSDRSAQLASDLAGLDKVLADVRKHFGGEERVYLSGFSRGGNLAWHVGYVRPQWLHMLFPSCAVYHAECAVGARPEARSLPVLAFQGSGDPHRDYLEPLWVAAAAAARKHGIREMRRILTFRKHGWHYEEILIACHGHYLARQATGAESGAATISPGGTSRRGVKANAQLRRPYGFGAALSHSPEYAGRSTPNDVPSPTVSAVITSRTSR
jgi:predicted esterase